MPVPPEFLTQFEEYRAQAIYARQQNQHHDQRREIFLSFLGTAFGIDPADINREEFISLVRRHGWIDALFHDLVFEFKRDMERERKDGLREIRDYLSHLLNGAECVGLLTDGLLFEAYVLDGGELRQTDRIDLANTDDENTFLWLDSYLFSQKGVPPTSADLVRRFGAASPTFQGAARVFGKLLADLGDTPTIDTKKRQWRILLTRVYGSDVTSDDLFVRHTYLAQFAKVLAYSARNGDGASVHDEETLVRIVDGRAFNRRGIGNVGEADFFAWVLQPEVRDEALKVLRGLAGSLIVYDLAQINEDLFKQLYQNLVDPATRHDLGEYYTPDWLAELTLEEIGYGPGKSLLDPSCGSGTFLFSAIRRLAAQGMTGWDLINFALDNIAGMDIHPLAATIARINYFLAILPHIDAPGGPMRDGKPYVGLLQIPIFVADALTAVESNSVDDVFTIPTNGDDKFVIPISAARDPVELLDMLNIMDSYARDLLRDPESPSLVTGFDLVIAKKFPTQSRRRDYDLTRSYWRNNFRLLYNLMTEKRNGIWLYVLKNRTQPLVMGLRKFDVIMGNPPWLSYRYIKDKGYQQDVKRLTFEYGLLESSEVRQFSNMDLSTLFYAYCEDRYLAENGTVAFVMPRSVITGAKQHRAFQQQGMTRIIDFKEVEPLFNVEACVVVRQIGQTAITDIPIARYAGRLPRHEMALAEAMPYLQRTEGTFSALVKSQVKSTYYFERFKAGATLIPRNLLFAKPIRIPPSGVTAFNPMLETDPEVDQGAKAPWKGIQLGGHVDPPFWFATLLSKHLMPFGIRHYSLVVLPLEVLKDGNVIRIADQDISERGLVQTRQEWLAPAEKIWHSLKKETTGFSELFERLDYHHTLLGQRVRGTFKTIYNKSGTNIAAVVVNTLGETPKAYGYPTQGFVADRVTYCFDTETETEAHYLCAVLNAPCVDAAIKPYQSRGLFGERDITRRPFEYCAIPVFNPKNKDHARLAKLSQQAHAAVAELSLEGMGTARARAAARQAAASKLAEIDPIARRLIGL
jgi:hypothetical protein